MNKFIKNNIIGFILGAIIFSSITVFALNLTASTTSFAPDDEDWDVATVDEALNSLYVSQNKKEFTYVCNSFDKTGLAIGCSIELPNGNDIKRLTIKNITLKNASIQNSGYVLDNGPDTPNVSIGDTFEVNHKSAYIYFYGNATTTYGSIKITVEIE